mgnify:CR=1 FL=1
MTLRTKGEQKAYLDGYEMCANCIKKYLTDEDKQKLECLLAAVRNAVDIEDETSIKALAQQPREDIEVIKVSKGAVKARQGRFVIYDVEWFKKNFYLTEEKIYGQPKQPCEDCISRKAELLDGLAIIAKAKAKSDAQKALMGRVMYFTEQMLGDADEEIDCPLHGEHEEGIWDNGYRRGYGRAMLDFGLENWGKPSEMLDQIRAEIKAMSGDIETIADVLAIIDKYKAEK